MQTKLAIEQDSLYEIFSAGLRGWQSNLNYEYTDEDFFSYAFEQIQYLDIGFPELKQLVMKHYAEIWQRIGFLLRKYQTRMEVTINASGYTYSFKTNEDAHFYLNLLILLDIAQAGQNTVERLIQPNPHFELKLTTEQTDLELHYLTEDTYIKSLRGDANCFFQECIKGLIQITEEDRKQALRLGKHKSFTIFAQGYFAYEDKNNRFPNDEAKQAFKNKKKGHSSHQSTSLYVREAPVELYKPQGKLAEDIVSLTFNPHEYVFNRLILRPLSTAMRPLEKSTQAEAAMVYNTIKPMLFAEYKPFREAVAKNNSHINEAMPYLKWSLNTSGIILAQNNFSARCVAHHYARCIHQRLEKQFAVSGKALPPRYKVPIHYQYPDNWRCISETQDLQDRDYSSRIFSSNDLLEKMLTTRKPYFLFWLNKDECNELLNKKYKGINILFYLVCHGFFEIVDYVYANTDLAQQKTLGDYLKDNKGDEEIKFTKIHIKEMTANLMIPILAAIQRNRHDLYDILGYQSDLEDTLGWTPLTTAIQHGKIEFLEKILNQIKEPSILNTINKKMHKNSFKQALDLGNEKIIKLLLNKLFFVQEAVDDLSLAKSITPKLPIAKSAFTTNELCEAADYAIKANNRLIIKELLFYACNVSNFELFQKLLKISPPAMIMQKQDNETILHHITYQNKFPLLQELLKYEAGIDLLMDEENFSSLAALAETLNFDKTARLFVSVKQRIELEGKQGFLKPFSIKSDTKKVLEVRNKSNSTKNSSEPTPATSTLIDLISNNSSTSATATSMMINPTSNNSSTSATAISTMINPTSNNSSTSDTPINKMLYPPLLHWPYLTNSNSSNSATATNVMLHPALNWPYSTNNNSSNSTAATHVMINPVLTLNYPETTNNNSSNSPTMTANPKPNPQNPTQTRWQFETEMAQPQPENEPLIRKRKRKRNIENEDQTPNKDPRISNTGPGRR